METLKMVHIREKKRKLKEYGLKRLFFFFFFCFGNLAQGNYFITIMGMKRNISEGP